MPRVLGGSLRTLFVSDISPQPWRYGGAMRADAVTQVLAGYGPVDMLLLRHEYTPDPLPPMIFSRIHVVDLPQPGDSDIDRISADRLEMDRRWVLERLPPWICNANYDLVWYNRERSWLRVGSLGSAPSIVDADDFEDVLLHRWLRIGRTSAGEPLTPRVATRMRRDAEWWADVHRRIAREVTVVLVASEQDRRALGHANVMVLPNSYQPEPSNESAAGGIRSPNLLYAAALDWPPNEDAAVWLVEELVPIMRRGIPDLRVVLVGYASARVQRLGRTTNVEVTGKVPSMLPYLNAACAVVVPLRVGGGTRIKILEGFAHRVPVVSTSVGAEGLDAVPDVHLAIADQPHEFAAACVRLLTDRRTAERLALAGYRLYQRQYRPEHAAERIDRAVRTALTGRSPGVTRGS